MAKKKSDKDLLKSVSPGKIFIPIAIGLAYIGYMMYKEVDLDKLTSIQLAKYAVIWIILAFLMMVIRDFGYIVRLKILSDGKFTWLQAFRVIMLWEFTSAVTPSAIGGTSVAILYVNKEGMSVGESSSVVMATSFLDELYFILMFPLLFFAISPAQLFGIDGETDIYNKFFYFAVGGYSIKLAYLLILSYGLFKNPRGLKWLILMIFKLPILRRWKHGANDAGTEIIKSSRELKKKPFKFWLKAFAATFFSWTARYWIVNILLISLLLSKYTTGDHFLIFARQLVMWIMMIIFPTPGGSGFAEGFFEVFLGDFIPNVGGLAIALALVWRLVSYYPYLIIGAFMLPKWIKRHFLEGKNKLEKK